MFLLTTPIGNSKVKRSTSFNKGITLYLFLRSMVASVLFTFTLNSTHLFHAWIYNDEEITAVAIRTSALDNVLNVLLCDSFRLAWCPQPVLWRGKPLLRTSQSTTGHGGGNTARGDWDLEILGRSRDDFLWKTGNMDPSCLILVTLGNYLE